MGNLPHVLVVSPDYPFPPNHGGRADVLSIIRGLSARGIVPDLLVTVKSEIAESDVLALKGLVGNIWFVRRSQSFLDIFSILPYQIKSRKGLCYLNEVETHYDKVLLISDYVLPVVWGGGLSFDRVELRVQNNEARYFFELSKASRNIFKKLFFIVESLKFWLLSFWLPKWVDAFLYISSDEYLSSRWPSLSCWCPPVVLSRSLRHPSLSGCSVLFSGSLFMPNNMDGLVWYLKNVHPLLIRVPEYKLTIAGRFDGVTLPEQLISSHVDLVHSPSDQEMLALQDSASVFIAPMFHGAGLKMKVINAVVSGLPVVCTPVSSAGSGLISGKHVLIADDPLVFYECVMKVLFDKNFARSLVSAAQDYVVANYSVDCFLK